MNHKSEGKITLNMQAQKNVTGFSVQGDLSF